MSPTSNVCTGAVPSLEQHSIGRFLRAGMAVSLSTDDPAFFGTSLNREYAAVAREFHLSREEIITLARNGFEVAFLPEADRKRLLEAFDRDVSDL
jgi:adenosine deaminase